MSRILVTGADGFVGRALVSRLGNAGNTVLAAVRGDAGLVPGAANVIEVGDARLFHEWTPLLEGVDAVVHLAARAHVMKEKSGNSLALFRAVNVQPTIELFKSCQKATVSRFIFVSTIGVNGTMTTGSPFRESDLPNPSEPYSQSKFEAELELRRALEAGSTDLVILRPALIYGPRAKGNFLRLMRWVDRGWPVPIGVHDSRRSFLGLERFCELVARCIVHPAARNETFVASDDESVGVGELMRTIGIAMHRKIRLVRIRRPFFELLGSAVGMGAIVARLLDSLEVDPAKAKKMLDWDCAGGLSPDLNSMVRAYLEALRINA